MWAEDAFYGGVWIKVFDFWSYLTEKTFFPMFISVMYGGYEANVADIVPVIKVIGFQINTSPI